MALRPNQRNGAVLVAARCGVIARGAVYVVLGWISVLVVAGRSQAQLDQQGALAHLARGTFGRVLLVVLIAGLVAYVLWRLSQALWGTPVAGRRAGPRLTALGQAIAYAALCVSAVALLVGSRRQNDDQKQEGVTARAMRHTGGRWLIAVVGAVVVIVGAVMIVQAVRRRFLRELDTGGMSHRTRRAVTALGLFGLIARGVVIGTAGALVIDAAATADPTKSTGLDGALRTLAHGPGGPWLLGAAAIGLIAFGVYSATSARWIRS